VATTGEGDAEQPSSPSLLRGVTQSAGGICLLAVACAAAAGDCHHVSKLRPAFGHDEVTPAVFRIQVRRFRVARAHAAPQKARLCQPLAAGHINLAEIGAEETIVSGGGGKVGFAIVEQQRGINALLVNGERVRPLACRVVGMHRCEQAAPDFSPGLKRASTRSMVGWIHACMLGRSFLALSHALVPK